jgi:adenylate cyclase
MLGELVPCGGGDPIPLLRPALLVGRRSRCDIALPFPNISSHHCNLELINGYWLVRDLGSRNGIKVNGVRCDQKWLLPHDVLDIAKHRFEIVYTPQGSAPPPEEENPFALSLMEKAGLERSREPRSRRTSASVPQKRTLPPAEGPLGDDDIALGFLNEE